MSFAEHRDTLVDSVFDELGEDAIWGVGAAVRVRVSDKDVDSDFGAVGLIMTATWLRVRRRDVESPKSGDVVILLDDAGDATGITYTVTGEPRMTRNRVWMMPAQMALA